MTTTLQVFLVCLWLGVVSFGGGLTIVPEMQRQLVELHGWVSAREFTDGYALAQLSPGPNMLCVSFYGFRIAGLAAGLLAAAAIVLPGVVLSLICGRAWERLAESRLLLHLRRGIVPVGLGLMAGGVFVVGRTTVTSIPSLFLALAVGLAVNRRWVHPALAVLAAGTLGAVLDLS